jgi:hypothetical protein
MNIKNKQLDDAIGCTEIMLKDAEAGNWDRVMDIEIQRSELLEKLFSTPNQNNSIDNSVIDMDNKIQKIIDINKRLEAIAITARADSGQHIASINNGRRAVNAYVQHSN